MPSSATVLDVLAVSYKQAIKSLCLLRGWSRTVCDWTCVASELDTGTVTCSLAGGPVGLEYTIVGGDLRLPVTAWSC